MTANLDELKSKLYKAFDDAIGKAENYNVGNDARARFYESAARLADSIVKTEARLDARKDAENGMRLPGKR
jgi:hypothetical protein